MKHLWSPYQRGQETLADQGGCIRALPTHKPGQAAINKFYHIPRRTKSGIFIFRDETKPSRLSKNENLQFQPVHILGICCGGGIGKHRELKIRNVIPKVNALKGNPRLKIGLTTTARTADTYCEKDHKKH